MLAVNTAVDADVGVVTAITEQSLLGTRVMSSLPLNPTLVPCYIVDINQCLLNLPFTTRSEILRARQRYENNGGGNSLNQNDQETLIKEWD